MKSTFIKHAPYVQLTASEGRISVRPSASATTRPGLSVDMRKACARIRVCARVRTSLVIFFQAQGQAYNPQGQAQGQVPILQVYV